MKDAKSRQKKKRPVEIALSSTKLDSRLEELLLSLRKYQKIETKPLKTTEEQQKASIKKDELQKIKKILDKIKNFDQKIKDLDTTAVQKKLKKNKIDLFEERAKLYRRKEQLLQEYLPLIEASLFVLEASQDDGFEEQQLQDKIKILSLTLDKNRSLREKYNPKADEVYPLLLLNKIEKILKDSNPKIQAISAQLNGGLEFSERKKLMVEQMIFLIEENEKINPFAEQLENYFSKDIQKEKYQKLTLKFMTKQSILEDAVKVIQPLIDSFRSQKDDVKAEKELFSRLLDEKDILISEVTHCFNQDLPTEELEKNYKELANTQVKLGEIHSKLISLTKQLEAKKDQLQVKKASTMLDTLHRIYEATVVDIRRDEHEASFAGQLKKLLINKDGAFKLLSTIPSMETKDEIEPIYQTVIAVINTQKQNLTQFLNDCNQVNVVAPFDKTLSIQLGRAISAVKHDGKNAEGFILSLQNLLQTSQYFNVDFINTSKSKTANQLTRKIEEKLDADYPGINIENNQFSYNGELYPLSKDSKIETQVIDYILQKQKIALGLSLGDEPGTDYLDVKKTLDQNKTYIETYINNYHRIQTLINPQLEGLPLIWINEDGTSFNYQGENYPLMNSIQPDLKAYVDAKEALFASKDNYDEKINYEAKLELANKNKQLIAKFTGDHRRLLRDVEQRLNDSKYNEISISDSTFKLAEKNYPLTEYIHGKISAYNSRKKIQAWKEEKYDLTIKNYSEEYEKLYPLMHEIKQFTQKQDEIKKKIAQVLTTSPCISFSEDNLFFTWNDNKYPCNPELKEIIDVYRSVYQQLDKANQSILDPKINYEEKLGIFNTNKKKIELFINSKGAKISAFVIGRTKYFDKKMTGLSSIRDCIEAEKNEKTELNESQKETLDLFINFFDKTIARLKQSKEHIEAPNFATSLNEAVNLDLKIQSELTTNNKQNKDITLSLKQFFDNNLPKLTSSATCGQLRAFFEWINKNVVHAIYNLIAKEPKEYKPCFFATDVHKKIHRFSKELLGDSFKALEKKEALEKESIATPSSLGSTSCV